MPLINYTTGTNTNDATATAADLLNPKTAYVKGELITGEIETKNENDLQVSGSNIIVPTGYYEEQINKSVATTSHPNPTISFNTSTGKITASHTQTEGYVAAGTTTAEQTLTTKSSSNLTVSGATVTAPAGYYPTAASKSITTVTQATPSISISSAGKITASATQSAGYVAAGTKSGTKQMTTKAASTITPGITDQTIAAGTYLTGAQTIKGDANLLSSNIKSGVDIFGVTGNFTSLPSIHLEHFEPVVSSSLVTNIIVAQDFEGKPINITIKLTSADSYYSMQILYAEINLITDHALFVFRYSSSTSYGYSCSASSVLTYDEGEYIPGSGLFYKTYTLNCPYTNKGQIGLGPDSYYDFQCVEV